MKRNKERKGKKEQWKRRQDAGNKRQHGDEPQKLLDKKKDSSRGRMRNQMEHHWKT
jgi:hypothetical protein